MGSTAQFREFGPFYRNGVLVQSPRLYHYGAGTSVLKDAYTDRAKTTAAAQPIVGNSAGLITAYFDGVYQLEFRMSDDATAVATWDNVDLTEGIHTIRASALLPEITVLDGDTYTSSSIPITGCSLGDFVIASYTLGALNGLAVNASVEASGSVRITVFNNTGGTLILTAGSWNFLIFEN
jgi:hypothetical protein